MKATIHIQITAADLIDLAKKQVSSTEGTISQRAVGAATGEVVVYGAEGKQVAVFKGAQTVYEVTLCV